MSIKLNKFVVYIEQDEDGMYIGSIPSVPSCYAQGKTKEKMLKDLSGVLKLSLRNMDTSFLDKIHFVGIHNLDIPYVKTCSNQTKKIHQNS